MHRVEHDLLPQFQLITKLHKKNITEPQTFALFENGQTNKSRET